MAAQVASGERIWDRLVVRVSVVEVRPVRMGVPPLPMGVAVGVPG